MLTPLHQNLQRKRKRKELIIEMFDLLMASCEPGFVDSISVMCSLFNFQQASASSAIFPKHEPLHLQTLQKLALNRQSLP